MARGADTESIGAPRAPMLRAPEPPSRPAARRVKHAIDRVAAAFALLVTAPVILAIVAALKLVGPGPVLVRREQIGERGRPLLLRSFAITDELCRSSGWRLVAGTGATALPQLWNVLRGELSIVGPRPREPGVEPPPVRPGLTGPAQLAQLERWLSITEQFELDDEYARTWSLALDARIVARTIWRELS
jgi:lipopolysaccharide/colanic/teichoic acid biosynthesis glycosyltransferase